MQTKFLVLALTVATFASSAAAQTSAQNPGTSQKQTTMAANASTTINAVLDKSVDAKKAKVGEQVEAKTTADARTATGTTIPRGSKLIGHVTEVKAHEKGSADAQSSLGIQFDRAMLKGGQEIPLHATIQAIAAPPQNTMPVGGDISAAGTGGGGYGQGGYGQGGYGGSNSAQRPMGGPVGQTASTAAGTVDTVGNVGGVATTGAAGQLGANATGVVGIRDLKLDTQASDSATSSVITSDNKNVKLDSGTQLVLRVTAQ